MKMAKADQNDLEAALDLCGAMEDLVRGYLPSALTPEDDEAPAWFDEDDSARVIEHLVSIAKRGSLFRVVFGMGVLLDPRNEVVDPDAGVLEIHPKYVKAEEQRDDLLATLMYCRKAVNDIADVQVIDAAIAKVKGGA